MTRHLAAVVLAAITVFPSTASAAGTEFGYVYTAETEEKGETELSLWATDRRGKNEGHYDAQDYRLEVERGITDRLQIAGYANFAGHHIHGLDGEFERTDRDFAFSGLSAEFIYQIADPKEGFGLALYAEPAWSRISKVKGEKADEFELELKAIVQKNFLGDRLVWASNLTLEPEWEREHEEVAPGIVQRKTEKELAIEVATGLSYRVRPRWWVGVEGRCHSVYPDWTNGLHRENYAVYAGPTVHYDGGEWSVTATWQPQLFGAPTERGSSLELDDHEKREFRLKLSYEF
jgi:hypothetical protein